MLLYYGLLAYFHGWKVLHGLQSDLHQKVIISSLSMHVTIFIGHYCIEDQNVHNIVIFHTCTCTYSETCLF